MNYRHTLSTRNNRSPGLIRFTLKTGPCGRTFVTINGKSLPPRNVNPRQPFSRSTVIWANFVVTQTLFCETVQRKRTSDLIFSSLEKQKSVIDLLYSGKLYSISMTAGWSPFKSKFKTWLFVKPMVDMPSIWWIRSPDARKSTAGPNVFNELIIGGYDRSVRSVDFINSIF